MLLGVIIRKGTTLRQIKTGCLNADMVKLEHYHAVTSPSRQAMSASNALISLTIVTSSWVARSDKSNG